MNWKRIEDEQPTDSLRKLVRRTVPGISIPRLEMHATVHEFVVAHWINGAWFNVHTMKFIDQVTHWSDFEEPIDG